MIEYVIIEIINYICYTHHSNVHQSVLVYTEELYL